MGSQGRWTRWTSSIALGAAALALLAYGGRPAAAQTLVDNLSQTTENAVVVDGPGAIIQSFTNDGSARTLDTVDVALGLFNGSTASHLGATLRAALPDGSVGAHIGTFAVASSLGDNLFRFTPTGTVSLLPSTSYWFVLQESGPGEALWHRTLSEAWTGSGSLPAAKSFGSISDGPDGSNAVYYARSVGPLKLRVIASESGATAVPEPGAFILFLPALTALPFSMRRRRAAIRR